MRYLGSQPGGLLFRAVVTALLILIAIVQFLRYAEEAQLETEKASVEQAIRVVDSGMVIHFSELMVNSQQDSLLAMDGANPFPLLEPYGLIPGEYRGAIPNLQSEDETPGWFYLIDTGDVVYRYRYQDKVERFRLSLKFDDRNDDGLLQKGAENVFSLHLDRIG